MAYCRFSSDDWQCDVYVYADVSGRWRTWVAGRRFIFNELPDTGPPPLESDEAFRAWWDRGQTLIEMRGDPAHGHWLELPVPEGGSDYWHDTPDECADNLERLRSAGFNVPQYAIDSLRRSMLRRKTPTRSRRSDTGPDRLTVEAVYERASWCCERCGDPVEPVRGVGHHVHHRRPRAAGGSKRPDTNSPANLLLLCPGCHADVESYRAAAVASGWLLTQMDNPAACAVMLHHGWWYLTDSGTYSTDPPEPADADPAGDPPTDPAEA